MHSHAAMSGANLSSLARSPWTVTNAVLAPGPSGQVGAQPASGLHLLAVPQAFPSPCRLKICPPAVVLMVALVRTAREVGYPIRRDQQSADARDDIPAALRQAVLAELTINTAQVAVSHAPHDGGGLGECHLYRAIGVANGTPTAHTHMPRGVRAAQAQGKITSAGLASLRYMSKSHSRRFPVTVTRLPVTRCEICRRTVAYRPGSLSEVLTEHYRRAHPEALGVPPR